MEKNRYRQRQNVAYGITCVGAGEGEITNRAEDIPRKHGNMINQNEVIWTRRKGVTKAQNMASYA